jgi:hypothetical protein
MAPSSRSAAALHRRLPRSYARIVGVAGALAVAPAAHAAEIAVLQGLDKVTARVSSFEAPIGEVVRFGTLEIVARTCRKRPPEETPESAAFLEITDNRPGETPRRIFSGWMFASSPALSALEHPVYDVWVVDCRNDSSSSAPRSR